MGALNSIVRQFAQMYDVVDPVFLAGMIYLLVRGRKRLTGVRFGLAAIAVVVGCYFVLFTLTAGVHIEERYYRPMLPFFGLLAALGAYCFIQDVRNRKVAYAVLGLIFAACIVVAVREPIRAHRRPQTEAGLWLRQHDPDYKGLVVSNWTQPVYYAGMKHFDSKGTEDLFLELYAKGMAFKYFILQGDLHPGDAWAQKYVDEHGWPLIHRDGKADIRIYQDPHYGERGEQPVPAPLRLRSGQAAAGP